MQIREATEADIPAIVNLLKISLGESRMPKSESFWRWKHIDNPFGPSPVLLAFDAEKLIGVRAFMRWNWSLGSEIIKAVRAVDTATHPDYQGKGIFRKLTMQLVDQCQAEGIQFIFNTPNKISKPGYLKMGWESIGRMQLYVKPIIKLNGKKHEGSPFTTMNFNPDFKNSQQDSLMTNPTTAFLTWRYGSSPNIKYFFFEGGIKDSYYATVYRLKPYRLGTEFRICGEFKNERVDADHYKKHLMEVIKQSGSNLVTSSARLFGSVGLNRGPEITVRRLSLLSNSLSFKNWSPTLGDMEVF